MSEKLMLKVSQDAVLSETKRWFGIYRGVRYEINNFPSYAGSGFESSWTYYLIINVTQQIPAHLHDGFWLAPKETRYSESGPLRISHDYMGAACGKLEFHGGCTYYSKESGLEGGDKYIKVGCDYQHLWDQGHRYTMAEVERDAKTSIDALAKMIGGEIKAWSYKDGKFYLPSEESK